MTDSSGVREGNPEDTLPELLNPGAPVVISEPGVGVEPYYVPFTEAIAEQVLEFYLTESLYKIASRPGMPGYNTLLKHARDNEAFREGLERARTIRAIHHEERALLVADEGLDKDDVPAARLAYDAAVWAAGINDPARYGKKTTIQGDASKPITLVIRTGVPEPTPNQRGIELAADGIVKEVACEVEEVLGGEP